MKAIRDRGDEVVAHGRTNAENMRGMWEADEARVLREVIDTIAQHEGRAPKGWMASGAYETPNTPDLLKELGFVYSMDWPMDDQPVWLRTRAGPLLSVPYPIELNDSQVVIHRKQDASDFCQMITEQFDEMIEQSVKHPLVMNISIHPYVFGQPFRLRMLRRALKHCREHPLASRVWWAKPEDVADHCLSLPAGIIPGG
jgi:allantoinase